jgi:ribonuclease HI
MEIVVYCDGLCEPTNPNGIATYGFVIYKHGIRQYEGSGVLGEGDGMSNNLAEYEALCKAVKYLKDNAMTDQEVTVKSDSKLLVNQMNGKWKVRKGLYVSKHKEARSLIASLENLEFQWVPREMNTEADALCRKAYEEYCIAKGLKPKYHNRIHAT